MFSATVVKVGLLTTLSCIAFFSFTRTQEGGKYAGGVAAGAVTGLVIGAICVDVK